MSKQLSTSDKAIKNRVLKADINNYLLGIIDYSDRTVKGADSNGNIVDLPVILEGDKAKVNFIMSTFEAEYIHPNNRNGNRVNIFAEWLQGLPSCFNVDYENHAIIEIAKQWGSIPTNATETQEWKIIKNWFNYIANKFFQLHKELNSKKGHYNY